MDAAIPVGDGPGEWAASRRVNHRHAMGGEDSGARRREAERDGVHAARSERAAASRLYVYAVHRRFVHGPRHVFCEARVRIRAGGRAGTRKFRRRIRAVCK